MVLDVPFDPSKFSESNYGWWGVQAAAKDRENQKVTIRAAGMSPIFCRGKINDRLIPPRKHCLLYNR